jgi:hypothetical protein
VWQDDLGSIGTDLTMANTQQHFDACLFNIIIILDCLLFEAMEILHIAVTVCESATVYLYKTIFKAQQLVQCEAPAAVANPTLTHYMSPQ